MKFPLKYKINHPVGSGVFSIPYKGRDIIVIATVDKEWEHISVSIKNRNPNWDEMCFVKNLFWEEEEMCLQFHPKKSKYVNVHPHCLHIWKPPETIASLLENLENKEIK